MTSEISTGDVAPTVDPQVQRVGVMIDMEVFDEAAFRDAAYKRALQGGHDEDSAKEYLDEDEQSLESCAVMLIDPGTSPAGSSIIQSEGM